MVVLLIMGRLLVVDGRLKALNTPAFADRVQVTWAASSLTSGVTEMFWRPTGTTESNIFARVEWNESEQSVASWSIYTGYQQTVDVNTGGEIVDTYLEGYYMPGGI